MTDATHFNQQQMGEPPLQSVEYGDLLDIQPSSFRVALLLHTDIFLDLHLTNLTAQLVTFKVKTTARDRYQLKPTQGYIPPHATKQCKIVLSALNAYPDASNSKAVRDKFLVQSVTVGGEVDDLSRFWKEREARHGVKDGRYAYAEQIVKCKLNVPTADGGGGDGGDSPSRMESRMDRNERRVEALGGGGAGGGAEMIVVDEVKEQQPPAVVIQKQQGATPATASSNSTFASTPQRLSYPPAISTTSTPVQQSSLNTSGASAAASLSSAPHPSTTNQHDGGAAHPIPANSSNNASVGVGSSSGGSSGRSREYNELMDFTVKLTAQMEREKADTAIIADKYNKALAHIASLQKRLAVLSAQQRTGDRAVGGAGEAGERGDEEKGKAAPLSLSSGGGDGKEEKVNVEKASSLGGAGVGGNGAAVGMRERLMSGDGVRNNSGGYTWQIYQIILVAIIAFVLGRMFTK